MQGLLKPLKRGPRGLAEPKEEPKGCCREERGRLVGKGGREIQMAGGEREEETVARRRRSSPWLPPVEGWATGDTAEGERRKKKKKKNKKKKK